MEASSPHPRGCSHPGAGTTGASLVVPAPAGVFRRAARTPRRSRRRPRTRGGVPSDLAASGYPLGSSPHPRGCSVGRDHGPDHLEVVPAPAGVFPGVTCDVNAGGRRPRTRGGVPGIIDLTIAKDRSSPHPRGCSLQLCEVEPGKVVVPAPAGVFPGPSPVPARCGCRPRTRGGVPAVADAPDDRHASSPHPRGCSLDALPPETWLTVVPAPAGVFPTGRSSWPRRPRRPRTRGGVPKHPHPMSPITMSSPHPRGCSPA